MNNIRKNPPPNQARRPPPYPPRYPPPNPNTQAGGLYDRDGPIPVPDVEESDTESVWALFQHSLPPGERRPDASSGDEPFEETVAAPLNP